MCTMCKIGVSMILIEAIIGGADLVFIKPSSMIGYILSGGGMLVTLIICAV